MADKNTAPLPVPTNWESIGKITLSDIGCAGEAAGALPQDGDRILLARVAGQATGFKTKEDKRSGTFHTSLTGVFRAINYQPGTANYGKGFTSGVAFLPAGLHEQVLSVLEAADASGDHASVEFGYDIYAYKKTRGTGAKHSYAAKPLIAPSAEDPITKLMASFEAPTVPQLAAPKDGAPKDEPATA